MKRFSFISLFVVLAVLIVAVFPASAQLGDTDVSSFTVQNVGIDTASVTITFVEEDGTQITPTELNSGQTNPFSLAVGEFFEVYVPGIPSGQLPTGRFSVIIAADQQIVAIANLVGQGTVNFNGSYSGFSSGAPTFYLPSVVFNYYGWYSLISVQNVGSGLADVEVEITCSDGTVGMLTATDVPSMASVHFDLETTTPTGFTSSTDCNGSAEVTGGGENVVVVDNQTAPSSGNTQSYSGIAAGAPKVYVPALYTGYYGWSSSVNVRKLGTGNVSVSAAYSDSGSSSCSLTDAAPSCLLYMPAEHPTAGYYGATLTATGGDIVAVVNAANGSQAQTYNGVADGSGTMVVGIPSVMKNYYGWNTSFTCQNIGSGSTSLEIAYDGYAGDVYDTAVLGVGDTVEVVQGSESFLPNGHQGGTTVTANTSGSAISCVVNFNNAGLMSTGDWSMSYNAFNK